MPEKVINGGTGWRKLVLSLLTTLLATLLAHYKWPADQILAVVSPMLAGLLGVAYQDGQREKRKAAEALGKPALEAPQD